MRFNQFLLMLIAILAISTVVSAQEINMVQLKQMMESSSGNLTTYAYTRSAEADIIYTNNTIHKDINLAKSTNGEVDLVNQSGMWRSNLTDRNNGNMLTWDGYFVNGSEYWKEGQNWTRFYVRNRAQVMDDYNEIPGQINLIWYSNMKIVGQENFQGEDVYKLVGSPLMPIYRGMIGLQLLTAYLESPFPLPDRLARRTLDISRTGLLNNSSIVLTAWVSKNNSLLRRLNINSSLNITPQNLNISSPSYTIKSTINESTVYDSFGAPLKIELPADAQNVSFRLRAADWRWAVFGSVRP
ncbi:MAG: hypothetical protein ACE14P_00140 [Methanotrichaceae archaeon]